MPILIDGVQNTGDQAGQIAASLRGSSAKTHFEEWAGSASVIRSIPAQIGRQLAQAVLDQQNLSGSGKRTVTRCEKSPGSGPGPRFYFNAAPPACEIVLSCEPAPPDTPIAPTILPTSTRGLPPRDKM